MHSLGVPVLPRHQAQQSLSGHYPIGGAWQKQQPDRASNPGEHQDPGKRGTDEGRGSGEDPSQV